MMEQQELPITYNSLGFLVSDVPNEIMLALKEEANKIKSDFSAATKHNEHLAGNIEHEFRSIKMQEILYDFILCLAEQYENYYKYVRDLKILRPNTNLSLESVWVNFQKKHEFNPIHTHDGLLSFVIWLDIPYLIEDEINNKLCANSKTKVPGHFYFVTTETLGKIITTLIPADKTYEGKILMFPAAMPHGVYPFYTSDNYRISLSGNIAVGKGIIFS